MDADKTITIDTAGGINDGTDKSFSVQLLNFVSSGPTVVPPGGGGGGGGNTATATIVRPQLGISSPKMPPGVIAVPNDGTRVEVDRTRWSTKRWQQRAT